MVDFDLLEFEYQDICQSSLNVNIYLDVSNFERVFFIWLVLLSDNLLPVVIWKYLAANSGGLYLESKWSIPQTSLVLVSCYESISCGHFDTKIIMIGLESSRCGVKCWNTLKMPASTLLSRFIHICGIKSDSTVVFSTHFYRFCRIFIHTNHLESNKSFHPRKSFRSYTHTTCWAVMQA